MLDTLIGQGAPVNSSTSSPFEYHGETVLSGTTPLMAAIAGNRDENAMLLIKKGANIRATTRNGVDALFIAAAKGDEKMVKILLQRGANSRNTTTQDFTSEGRTVFAGSNALMAASDGGYTGIVKLLIRARANVNASTKAGTTALMAASAKGHLDIVKILIALRADVNAKTTERYEIGKEVVPKGSSALAMAASGGYADVVQILIDNGADVNTKDEEYLVDPLFLASSKCHSEAAEILIENGADVFAVSHHGTALNTAEHNGCEKIPSMILNAREEVKKEKEATETEE
jgi:ankyrin repeat protein